jgi:electron transfer flavoprotein alpha/beta subunit
MAWCLHVIAAKDKFTPLGVAVYLHYHLAPRVADILGNEAEQDIAATDADEATQETTKCELPSVLSSRAILEHGSESALFLMLQYDQQPVSRRRSGDDSVR